MTMVCQMKTQSIEIVRKKKTTNVFIDQQMFVGLWFYEGTDDDIQIENQLDIDCEDDDEDILKSIYQNDVSINFIVVEQHHIFMSYIFSFYKNKIYIHLLNVKKNTICMVLHVLIKLSSLFIHIHIVFR